MQYEYLASNIEWQYAHEFISKLVYLKLEQCNYIVIGKKIELASRYTEGLCIWLMLALKNWITSASCLFSPTCA